VGGRGGGGAARGAPPGAGGRRKLDNAKRHYIQFLPRITRLV
jgi:hypothetical protein